MPTYEYACTKCGHTFEVMQSFSEAPITKCQTCKGKVRKLFSPPAIIFKGKGFHCTDYKNKGGQTVTCPKESGSDEPCEAATCPVADSKGKCAAS